MRILRYLLFAVLVLNPLIAAGQPVQSVIIHKSERTLRLFADGIEVKTYKIALGTLPVGTKLKQGDRKTPEGTYYICRKNPNSQFYLSLGLSYPNKQDAERGYREKLINKRTRDRIIRAIDRGVCPPWNTALGGEIFIHGNGSKPDWTWGCVALDDLQMKELYELLPIGTKVEIKP